MYVPGFRHLRSLVFTTNNLVITRKGIQSQKLHNWTGLLFFYNRKNKMAARSRTVCAVCTLYSHKDGDYGVFFTSHRSSFLARRLG
jgi:hypothetical protein